MNAVDKKLDKLLAEIVRETIRHDWKHALEAIQELASMVKSNGGTKPDFDLIMGDLHAEIELRSQEADILQKLALALKNKAYYMGKSPIILVH